jgi:hypothetical protein
VQLLPADVDCRQQLRGRAVWLGAARRAHVAHRLLGGARVGAPVVAAPECEVCE